MKKIFIYDDLDYSIIKHYIESTKHLKMEINIWIFYTEHLIISITKKSIYKEIKKYITKLRIKNRLIKKDTYGTDITS